jgi:hypothetical protein
VLQMSETPLPSDVPRETAASRVFVGILYLGTGVHLFFNVLALLSGQLVALLPVAVQGAVILSVYLRTEWAWKLVCVWGAFMLIAGGARWLANLIGPEPIEFLSANNLRLTAWLGLGIYLLVFAREFLSERVALASKSTDTR